MTGRTTDTDPGSNAIKCPNCGSNRVETQHVEDRFVYGNGATAVELSALIPFRECVECGFEFTDAEAEDARHEAICRHLGIMAPAEVIGVRQRYGMTRAVFAERTRFGEASLARWETGQLIQNAANDNYLFLLCFPDNMERLSCRYSFDRVSVQRVLGAAQPRFRELHSDDVSARRQEARDFLHPSRRMVAQ